MYKDKGRQKEAVKKAVAKHRGITGEGITGEVDVIPLVRLNPANGMPYEFMSWNREVVLSEYERHWGQFEPMYGRVRGSCLAEVLANPEKRVRLSQVIVSLEMKGLGKYVTFGVGGPTLKELAPLI